jgi:hypothetical protein
MHFVQHTKSILRISCTEKQENFDILLGEKIYITRIQPYNYEHLSHIQNTQNAVNFLLSGTKVPGEHFKENLPHTKHFKITNI